MADHHAPTYGATHGHPPPAGPTGSNGLAVAGFVLGLLGLLGSWIPFLNVVGIILCVIGIVLAAVGLGRSRKAHAGKGLAIAGLVMGVLGIVIAVAVNSAFVDAVDDATSNSVDSSGSNDGDSDDETGGGGSESGSSRDNAAPLGSAVSGGDWTVTVNSVEPIDQDSLGSRAQDGSILLQVNVTATYNGDDEQGSTPFSSFDYVTPDGTTISSLDGSTLFIAEDEFDSLTTVYADGEVTGDTIIEVPAENWQRGVLAVSPDILSDDSFIALRGAGS